MKRIILIIVVIFFAATAAGLLDFMFIKLASLSRTRWQQQQIHFDVFYMEISFLLLLGIPYMLHLIVFKLLVKKVTSPKVKGVFTGLVSCLLYLVVINTLTMGVSPNIFDLNILITLIVFLISGYSLPFIDEFMMTKFRM